MSTTPPRALAKMRHNNTVRGPAFVVHMSVAEIEMAILALERARLHGLTASALEAESHRLEQRLLDLRAGR